MDYVAFVRAINVAGHGRVRMVNLRDAFASAGCTGVRTYIQSGNVLFSAPERNSRRIVRDVKRVLCGLVGEEPEIVFRRVNDVRRLVRQDPFGSVRAPDVKLYVAFLSRRPQRIPRFPFASAEEALEAIGMEGRDVFIVSRRRKSGFYGFPNNFIEGELNVVATSRNWSTVTRISAL